MLITLKLGTSEYTITEKDRFVEDCLGTRLVSQTKCIGRKGKKIYPRLNERAIKAIGQFKKVELEEGANNHVLFRLQDAPKAAVPA